MNVKRPGSSIQSRAARLRWHTDRWFFLVGGLFYALLLMIHAAQYKALQNLLSQNHWALHSEEVRADLNAIRAESLASENAVRGYVITGDSTYLASYHSTSIRSKNLLRQVERLTADNASQQEPLQDLGVLLVRKDTLMGQLIDERTLRGNTVFNRMALRGSGIQLTQRISLTIQTMCGEEQQLLMRRSASAEESATRTIRTSSLALALALTILGLAGLALSRHIARRNQAEIQLRHERDLVRQRTAQLEASNKELEAFSYSVSHDLRAPLRQIGGFAQLLTEVCGPEMNASGTHYLKRITEGCNRMSALVEGLLQLARTGRQELARRQTNLRDLVENLITDMTSEAQCRKVEWKVGALPEADCDPVLIRQVFANLLSNAVKFTRGREPGVIEVKQVQRDGERPILVRDNGAGFDMKYAGKLFGAFQRLHRAEDFDGIGIGLATVERIIHKHGGKLWAEAEPDRGATFYFTLEPPVKEPTVDSYTNKGGKP